MAKNNLTPEQDLIVREFYEKVVLPDPGLFVNANLTQRQALHLCLNLLGYVVVQGKHISVDKWKATSYKFGGSTESVYVDEYDTDKEAAHEAANKDTPRPETDSGKPSESPSVRQTIFRKDV